MPWEDRTAMDQRKQFIEEVQLEQDGLPSCVESMKFPGRLGTSGWYGSRPKEKPGWRI